MKKLLELPREEFIKEVTDNFDTYKKTTVKQFAKYMVENALTKKSEGTLSKLSRKDIRDIIINGDSEDKDIPSSIDKGLGAEIMEFLEDIKNDLHERRFNPFVKKTAIKQIDKHMEKIEDESIFDKLPYVGAIIVFVLIVLEMLFKNGYKDISKKLKELRAKRQEVLDDSKQ
jgi:hypothetical protein